MRRKTMNCKGLIPKMFICSILLTLLIGCGEMTVETETMPIPSTDTPIPGFSEMTVETETMPILNLPGETSISEAGESEPAPLEERSGKWSTSTLCGDASFDVDSDGKNISKIEILLARTPSDATLVVGDQVKGKKMDISITGETEIAEDGSFNFSILEVLNGITFRGKFSADANTVTGIWSDNSSCSSDWIAKKVP
jgi:hypothetical protein